MYMPQVTQCTSFRFQDMIVVIQSDDFDQSQGLIVVDPSQIQHVVSADGVRSTTVTTADGTTMILGETSSRQDDDDQGKNIQEPFNSQRYLRFKWLTFSGH